MWWPYIHSSEFHVCNKLTYTPENTDPSTYTKQTKLSNQPESGRWVTSRYLHWTGEYWCPRSGSYRSDQTDSPQVLCRVDACYISQHGSSHSLPKAASEPWGVSQGTCLLKWPLSSGVPVVKVKL